MKYKRQNLTTLNKMHSTHPHLKGVSKWWVASDGDDESYHILYDEIQGKKHLRIKKVDDTPIHNFMKMQEIKNDLWGKETIAIEIYPKQSDFIDGSNTYHLWTWEGIDVPNLNKLYQYR